MISPTLTTMTFGRFKLIYQPTDVDRPAMNRASERCSGELHTYKQWLLIFHTVRSGL